MERIAVARLVGSEDDAEEAFRALGAERVAELTLPGTIPSFGPVERWFGILKRLPLVGPVHDELAPLLALPENKEVAKNLPHAGHLPVNRWIVGALAERLLPTRVHLPFTFRPLNSDLAALIERIADQEGFRFRAFFNQGVLFEGDAVVLKRMFSLPVRGSAQGTEHDPYLDTVLDDGLAMVVETFVRPG